MQLIIYSLSFVFIALAAKKIGEAFAKVGLPYITGYILAGMAAGPFILNLLPEGATETLRYIDELSLGIIAFVAGSELYLKEIRGRLRSISAITTGVIIAGFILISAVLFVLTQFIPFTDEMPVISRIAVAILGSTILLALSPASTIAVIQEVRARGTFTRTVLGVTVTMDVVIIVLFAIVVAVASALLTGVGFDATFLLLLAIDLGAAVVVGLGVGKLLQFILSTNLQRVPKIALVLLTGYAIFVLGYWLIGFSHDNLPFEIHVEPLLVAMIGGFLVTNFTPHRDEFAQILHDVGPFVYVAFFTLTGVALKLDILWATLPIAAVLFLTRAGSIGIGSFFGSRFAGESPKHGRIMWMGLITQAGIALGLAREVAVEFPSLGDAFATMIISVVVLNEIFGPILLKFALGRVGEANVPQPATPDEVRDAVILGIEEQALELARQLQANGWQVVMADTDRSHVDRLSAEDVAEYYIPVIDEESMSTLIKGSTDALVTLLNDDEDNLRACELAYKLGVGRLVVRPNDLANAVKFTEMGALVIDPTSAMVNLLDQSVRAPQSAAVLLHQDSGRELVQITVSNPDVDGQLLRDLRLPNDVLFLDVTRHGQTLVPHGYTRIQLNDEVTLVGGAKSLEEATLKLGY